MIHNVFIHLLFAISEPEPNIEVGPLCLEYFSGYTEEEFIAQGLVTPSFATRLTFDQEQGMLAINRGDVRVADFQFSIDRNGVCRHLANNNINIQEAEDANQRFARFCLSTSGAMSNTDPLEISLTTYQSNDELLLEGLRSINYCAPTGEVLVNLSLVSD